MQIKYVKPQSIGNSYFFLIPKQYVTNGIIHLDKRYDLKVDKADEAHFDTAYNEAKRQEDNKIIDKTVS